MNQPANHFHRALKAILDAEPISARAFAQKIGINNSVISRLGESRVDSDSLARMVGYFSNRNDVVVSLLRAHLWDEVIRSGANPDTVWSSLVDGDIAWLAALPPGIQADLEVLGPEAVTNSGIRFSLTGMAQAILRGRAEQVDRSAKPQALYQQAEPAIQLAAEPEQTRPRKNAGAPTARASLPPKPKAS
ncbi:MAG TPA: hypothetical protein VK178_07035 [Opitutaceae bacterium]|nr:hypothetical protein [Opitutaceae bacterium]